MNQLGEPDAGKLPVRFDERRLETGLRLLRQSWTLLKTGSSKWLKTKAAHLSNFHWQSGYGIFSISPSHRLALESFITNQAEHHRLITFQDEYRQLLRKYDVECDARYVWD